MPAFWQAIWSRRRLLQRAAALLSLLFGGRILWRVFLPARLGPSQLETLAVILDTLIPDGDFPGARRTDVLERLLAECETTRQTRRALREGVDLVEDAARRRGAAFFAALADAQREAILAECAASARGSLPWFFFRTVRDRAMRLHYAHPLAWKALGLDHPPQPSGYIDYWQAPHA